MDLTVIIVSHNTEKLLIECIRSVVENTRGIKFETIVIDNDSTDGSVTAIKKLKFFPSKETRDEESEVPSFKIKLIKNDKNVGFGAANNQGIKQAKGSFILFLNSDTKIEDNVLGEMVNWMEKKVNLGIVTCSLKYPDGRIQATGGYFPTLLRVFSWMIIQDLPLVDKIIKPFHPLKDKSFSKNLDFYKEERSVDWITGAFMMIRKEVIDEVGGFDEDYFMYTEETDLCYRAKMKGWEIKYTPKWQIIHYGGASGTKEGSVLGEFKGIKIFYKKHYSKWEYLALRLILKLGALGRIILFGLMEGKESAKIYAKAFKNA